MNTPESIELYQRIAAGLLHPSPTNPRKTFDKKGLEELADSVRNEGVLAPLLVRPDRRHRGGYEVIAGERRLRAAKLAGLASLPCVVRDLTDAQVELHQAIEWVQHQDLHPLEEAEAYEGLAKRHGMSAEDIAAKVSKSASYIRGRMKLCALSEKARAWFLKGLLTPTTALLVARIPVPSLQDKAVEQMVGHDGNPLHATEAAALLRRNYMLRLDLARFPTGDAQLVPAAGACGPCPKRSGNQPELFGDVKAQDTCTDPDCFAGKKAAHVARVRAEAEARGQKVITGKAAEKIKPYEHSEPGKDWIELDARCYDDHKLRTYRELIGKEAPLPALLEKVSTGEFTEIVPRKDVAAALEAKGIGRAGGGYAAVKANEAKVKLERSIRWAIFEAIRAAPLALGQPDLALVAAQFFGRALDDSRKRIAKLYGWEKNQKQDAAIAALNPEQLARLLMDLALVGETHVMAHSTAKPEALAAAAERAGVDAAKIRAGMVAAARAEAKRAQKTAGGKKGRTGGTKTAGITPKESG